jgi:photosystem II stability/assembly factor-like uncharacterized protein
MKSVNNKVFLIVLSFLFVLILTASGIQDRLTGNWTYQEVPQLTSSIVDIKFLDSLTGFLTSYTYLYKTTDGGYNWSLNFSPNKQLHPIQFINNTTGFLGGATILYKTTNRGDNWFEIPKPMTIGINDLFALNEDTIWVADQENLDGGVFRTTNGGNNWTQQGAWGASNPNKIYMYNKNFGFINNNGSSTAWLMRTTNGGVDWSNVPGYSFEDIKFVDSLIGYKSYRDIKKTTDGGTSWTTLALPVESYYHINMAVLNKDSLWATGPAIFTGSNFYGILYNTTNGGQSIRYQIPDTTFNITNYVKIQFLNKNNGWVYKYNNGIHTTTGGDTTFILTGINNNPEQLFPKDFILYQNYPNPFNPFTTIKFGIKRSSDITLEVFDMKGSRIKTIIDYKRLNSGIYEYGFDGSSLSSGIYFYRLIINSKETLTKKMILVK